MRTEALTCKTFFLGWTNFSRYQKRWKHLFPIFLDHFELGIFGHTG